MNSWHFVDNYLIVVGGMEEIGLTAATYEDGVIVSSKLKPGDIGATVDRPGSQRCLAACADALWQRKSKTGFKTAQDVMEKLTTRWGGTTHEVDGMSYKVDRESNGDFVASVNHHFDTISLRLTRDGAFNEPTGSKLTGGFDPQVEKVHQVMRKLLSKRRDWELSTRLG